MEKKFKNRKTGDIGYYKDGVFKQGRCCVDIGHEPSNEFWEDVTEEYEILEIIGKYGAVSSYREEADKDLIDKSIFKVKRLPDGEVFTLRDKYTCGGGIGGMISKFTIFGDELLVNNGISLDELDVPKEALFTTEDGVEIFEGDTPYILTNENILSVAYNFSKKDFEGTKAKVFAKKENVEKYIEDNKKIYSRKDIETALSLYTEIISPKYIIKLLDK
jgi:hypothetical protein